MRHKPTPTFILALPLQVNAQQAARLHAHFECARQLYNALLAEAMKRLRRMKADPAWQAARRIPRSDKRARRQVFTRLRTQYGFSEYGLPQAGKRFPPRRLRATPYGLTAPTLTTPGVHLV